MELFKAAETVSLDEELSHKRHCTEETRASVDPAEDPINDVLAFLRMGHHCTYIATLGKWLPLEDELHDCCYLRSEALPRPYNRTPCQRRGSGPRGGNRDCRTEQDTRKPVPRPCDSFQ